MHLFFCYGVHKAYLCGMEHQAFCGLTIQTIAHDRCIQSFGMSGMDTELVGSPGERKEIHEDRTIVSALADMIARDGGLAVLPIHHLSRSVVWIRQKRQINLPF